jgi:hypothetical protein
MSSVTEPCCNARTAPWIPALACSPFFPVRSSGTEVVLPAQTFIFRNMSRQQSWSCQHAIAKIMHNVIEMFVDTSRHACSQYFVGSIISQYLNLLRRLIFSTHIARTLSAGNSQNNRNDGQQHWASKNAFSTDIREATAHHHANPATTCTITIWLLTLQGTKKPKHTTREPCNNMRNHNTASHPTGHDKPNSREKASLPPLLEDSLMGVNSSHGLSAHVHVVVGLASC